MTQWTRARLEMACGSCGRRIYVGQPMRVLSIAGLSRRLARCLDCSRAEGHRPPADLEPLPAIVPTPSPPQPVPMRVIAGKVVARDFRQLSEGDR